MSYRKEYWFIVNVERWHYLLSTNSGVLSEGECSDTEAVFDWMLRAMSLDREILLYLQCQLSNKGTT